MTDAPSRRLGLAVPAGWRLRDATGPPWFVSRARVVRPTDAAPSSWWMGGLADVEVAPRIWHRPRGDLGWTIAALDLVRSIAFGLSAIGARYLTTTGEPANITLVNVGTFIGAVCFFAGAALLPVESASGRTDRSPVSAGSTAGAEP